MTSKLLQKQANFEMYKKQKLQLTENYGTKAAENLMEKQHGVNNTCFNVQVISTHINIIVTLLKKKV